MASYRNGIETRKALYGSARHSFAQHGYFGASIQGIVRDANAKLGLFTYYFESKESLALQILSELQHAVRDSVTAHPAASALEGLPLSLLHARVWLALQTREASVQRFVRELCTCNAYLQHAEASLRELWQRLHPSAPFTDIIALGCSMATGMLRQFEQDLPLLQLSCPLEDALDRVLTAAFSLLERDTPRLCDAVSASRCAAQHISPRIGADFTVLA